VSYGETMAQYRAWLAQLPRAAADKIAHGNARRLFGS
jgi:predicted TIM-barrel fold metal-dependent hydrolase